MMDAYSLPTSLRVCGTDYAIRSDFRAVIDILIACADPDLTPWEQQEVMIEILYVDEIPARDYAEACRAAVEFIDCGAADDSKKRSYRVLDWEQDAGIIIPAVNKVASREVRALEYLHWWTFLGFFMEIEGGLFSQVLAIRQKKAKHKKLEKWEQEFLRENEKIVTIKKRMSEEQVKEIESIEKWL